MKHPWEAILRVIAFHATAWSRSYIEDQFRAMRERGVVPPEVVNFDRNTIYDLLHEAAKHYEAGPEAYALALWKSAKIEPVKTQILPKATYQMAFAYALQQAKNAQ